MANKLWDKGFKEDERIDAFTVGNDRELDHELAPYDIMGTMAHITMLESVGLLSRMIWTNCCRRSRNYIHQPARESFTWRTMWRTSTRRSS